MSYTKQTWATGDTITAAKLNHMEDGIAGAITPDLVVRVDGVMMNIYRNFTKQSGLTAAELWDKMANGEPIVAVFQGYYASGLYTQCSIDLPLCETTSAEGSVVFSCDRWETVTVVYDSNGIRAVE